MRAIEVFREKKKHCRMCCFIASFRVFLNGAKSELMSVGLHMDESQQRDWCWQTFYDSALHGRLQFVPRGHLRVDAAERLFRANESLKYKLFRRNYSIPDLVPTVMGQCPSYASNYELCWIVNYVLELAGAPGHVECCTSRDGCWTLWSSAQISQLLIDQFQFSIQVVPNGFYYALTPEHKEILRELDAAQKPQCRGFPVRAVKFEVPRPKTQQQRFFEQQLIPVGEPRRRRRTHARFFQSQQMPLGRATVDFSAFDEPPQYSSPTPSAAWAVTSDEYSGEAQDAPLRA